MKLLTTDDNDPGGKVFASVVDTGGKFAINAGLRKDVTAGVNDTGAKFAARTSTTPVVKFSPVSKTRVVHLD
jgi:hypothetical protein